MKDYSDQKTFYYLKMSRKDKELPAISSQGQGRTSPTGSIIIVQHEGKREKRTETVFEEIMAKNFLKPTEDLGHATSPKIHLSKSSENHRLKENPLKSNQRYQFKKKEKLSYINRDAYIGGQLFKKKETII